MLPMLALAALIQGPLAATAPRTHDNPHYAAANVAMAARAAQPPVIDGRDNDPVWANATVITAFREWRPNEDANPRFATEARVAYDAANLYVFVRAFDPHPDSILRILARRDTWTASDMIWVLVDSYHDHRNGYEFGVNAAGVKIDQAIYDDGNEDRAWDGVWDVATRVDSLGWTAEFRIPLSQMRYSSDSEHTFGISLLRDLYRYSEREAWPVLRQSKAGFVSQFGHLEGLEGLEAPRRLEAAPYLVTKNASRISGNSFDRSTNATLGADLKYRVLSNLTLDATVNPDFGQVESDPAVLNLTAYESFFDERRPFFVAGRGLFQFNVNCTAVNDCNTGEGLFYSRRIGRTPQLAGTYGDTTPQQPTTILTAGKLTGRFPGGLSLGVLDAVTQRASHGDTTYEPGANYAVVRVRQDLRGGESNVGALFTGVNRSLDAFSSPYLHRSAYAGAVDFSHRFPGKKYEIGGSLDFSQVNGTAQAIAALQQDAVHYYQRPDGGLPLDTTRTTLGGDAEEFRFAKVSGDLLFQTHYGRRSPGFEINDMGYLQQADQQAWSTWAGFFDRKKRALTQRFQWNFNWWQYWTTAGLPTERAFNTNWHITFNNNTSFHLGGTYGGLGTTYCDRCARGGPAVRQDTRLAPWAGFNGDDRKALVPFMWVNLQWGDGGRSHGVNLQPELDLRIASRFSSVLSLNWTRNISDRQWYGNFTDGTGALHYTFAHLEQTTVGLTLRLNYTITPDMSLQVYAQPFDSKGTYSNVRELSATPRAAGYDARYQVYGDTSVTNHPGGFNYKQFASNVVFRWEYRRGSTLFLVWNQGRQGVLGEQGAGGFQDDMRALFALHPMNTFLVKVSYWLNY